MTWLYLGAGLFAACWCIRLAHRWWTEDAGRVSESTLRRIRAEVEHEEPSRGKRVLRFQRGERPASTYTVEPGR